MKVNAPEADVVGELLVVEVVLEVVLELELELELDPDEDEEPDEDELELPVPFDRGAAEGERVDTHRCRRVEAGAAELPDREPDLQSRADSEDRRSCGVLRRCVLRAKGR